eukprot:1062020-Amphidinium_carterae.1
MGTPSGKDLFEYGVDAEYETADNMDNFAQLGVEEPDELVQLYEDVTHDVGEDSDLEDHIWVYATDLQYELDEQTVEQQLASFAHVQKQKAMLRKARGWFSPSSWTAGKGSEQGKEQGKGKKGLSSSTGSYGKSGKGLSTKGKPSGKGKQKGHSFDKFDWARHSRDERRTHNGLQRVNKSELTRSIRCWRCGQLGHLSRNCHASASSSHAGASSGPTQRNYFVLPFTGGKHDISPTLYAFMDHCDFLTLPSGLGVVDTGAVNAVLGMETLKAIDQQLARHGLGTVKTDTPPTIGGIGGGVQPLMGVLIPAVMEEVPGILSAVVIPGSVPLLLPNPLLDSLEACVDMRTKLIHWQSCGARSQLHMLPSGHSGCSVMGDWSMFFEKVPGAEQFVRTKEHDKHIESTARDRPPTHYTTTATQYFDLRDTTEASEECNEHECTAYESAWMPAQCHGSSAIKVVTFADDLHESSRVGCTAIHTRGGEYHQAKEVSDCSDFERVHHRGLLAGRSMDQNHEEAHLCDGGGVSPCDGDRDEGLVDLHQKCSTSTSRHSTCPKGDSVDPESPSGLKGSHEGCERPIMPACTPVAQGQRIECLVPVQDVSSTLHERKRGVHWPVMDEWLCAWTVLTPSEHFRLAQTCRRGQVQGHLRCQLGHCPALPWSTGEAKAEDLGYTGKIRCLGFTSDSSVVDSCMLPTCTWHGLILLERCADDTDPPHEMQPPSAVDSDQVWSLLTEGQLGKHVLRDGSELQLCVPQRRFPTSDVDLDVHMRAYQVALAMVETETGWTWDFTMRDAWPVEGRRKQKARKTDKVILGFIYTTSAARARTWRQLLQETQPPQWTDVESPWQPLPGFQVQQACVWKGAADFSDFSYPSSKVVLLHCVPRKDIMDLLCDKCVLIASPDVLSESQRHALVESDYYVSKCAVQGETTRWLLASRPEGLAVRVELQGEFNLETAIASVWQHLYPHQVDILEPLADNCWTDKTSHLSALSWRELVDEISTILHSSVIPTNSARTGVGDQNPTSFSDGLRIVTLGATTARRYGVTPSTTRPPWIRLLPYLLELARRRPAEKQHPFLSIVLTTGAVSAHEDYNDSLTSLISLGSYTSGGQLLIEDTPVDTYEKWAMVDTRQTHQVLPYHGGKRFSIAYYCPRDAAKLPSQALSHLKRLDFPVTWWASERCWRQTLWQMVPKENSEASLPTCDLDVCATTCDLDVCATPCDLRALSPSVSTHDVLAVDDMGDTEATVESVGASGEPASAASGPPLEESILDSSQRVEPPLVDEELPLSGDVGGLKEHEIEVPTKSQQASILRMHVNLGHPDLHSFLRSLRIGGVRRAVRAWVRFRFSCAACNAWRPRLQRRPAHINNVHRFNMAVALDNFHIEVPNVGKKTVLHTVCLGTRYQTAKVVVEGIVPTAEAVVAAFTDSWVAVFGWPQSVLVDAGVEFKGLFRDTLEHNGVYIGVINSQAPHENGICERAGGRLKELLHLSFDDIEPLSDLDFRVALATATSAHNRFYDRSGYSPVQRVMGVNPVYPEDLLSDRHPDSDVMAIDGSVSYERSLQVRAAALRAF